MPTLEATDKEDGALSTIIIETLPTNGKLYYDGKELTKGQKITNYDPKKLMIDPDDGDVEVKFTYASTDKAGVKSKPATVIMPFTNIEVSGNVYDDGNGDGNINGNPINKLDGKQLYVTLVNSAKVVATKDIADDGTYKFETADGVEPNKDYTVVLSIDANETIAKLQTTWNYADGEKSLNDKTNGNDGSADGVVTVKVRSADVQHNDFGINKKPVANDENKTPVLNPGGDSKVVVPELNYFDVEDKKPTTITIKELSNNGKLYYNGREATIGQKIENFDSSKLMVDPADGNQTVVFKYTTTDRAGVESNEATVEIPFIDIVISGYIFDDGNGNGSVDGKLINSAEDIALFVTLIDNSGNIIATTPLNSDSSYKFTTKNGVELNKDYSIILSIEVNATDTKLPENWVHAGQQPDNNGTGMDNNKTDGKLAVSTKKMSVDKNEKPNNDFSINKKPNANDNIIDDDDALVNVPGDKQYPVKLTISDKEDGTPSTVTIKTLPDPKEGVLYYDDKPVEEGQKIENFDPDKLTVDPEDGNNVVEFDYTTTDADGAESDQKHVRTPFIGAVDIGNTIWFDENLNGIQDKGEPGVIDIEVELLDINGKPVKDYLDNIIKPVKTDKNGHYLFKGVMPGFEYIVKVKIPEGYQETLSNKGNDDTKDSDANEQGIFKIKPMDYNKTYDVGIYCECDDYKVHPDRIKSISAPALNILGALVMLIAIFTVARKED